MTIKEIDEQIRQLQNERDRLYKQEIADFKKNAQNNVGRCFKTSTGAYAKVIGVPQEKYTKTGLDINMYQYPALFINDGVQPFDVGTLFTGAWGKPFEVGNVYEEITKEEFNAEFEKKLESFKRNVMGC